MFFRLNWSSHTLGRNSYKLQFSNAWVNSKKKHSVLCIYIYTYLYRKQQCELLMEWEPKVISRSAYLYIIFRPPPVTQTIKIWWEYLWWKMNKTLNLTEIYLIKLFVKKSMVQHIRENGFYLNIQNNAYKWHQMYVFLSKTLQLCNMNMF